MSDTPSFGLVGLAVMGQNLARNLAHHGVPVTVHNRTEARTRTFLEAHAAEGPLRGAATYAELVASLQRPRAIILMVKAGDAVDAALDELVPLLDRGDIVVDGGNSRFTDTRRRHDRLRDAGLHLLGTGVSGGEEGALRGPSIMPGGPREAYDAVAQTLRSIAAVAEGEPCCTYIGSDGAGHYVKTVHNGIEYGDMQLIAEAYDVLRSALGMSPADLAGVFDEWNRGDLESYLIEITAIVLRHVDGATGRPFIDIVLDEAQQKGTGSWGSQSALELGVPVTVITEAVYARCLSALKGERQQAERALAQAGTADGAHPGDGLVEAVRDALYAAKVVAYAQGFQLMSAAAQEYGWDLDLGAIASIWRGGCIIRARFLNRITEAYAEVPQLRNLLLAPHFAEAVQRNRAALARVVRTAADLGIPAPAFSSALAYLDGYRRGSGPASLIQGLRDHFGAHTYRRTDREGSFHTLWSGDRSEVSAG